MTTALAKLCLTIAVLTPAAAFAATQSVTESARHVLADNESKNDARQICASTAKRTALDKAGSLFESDLTARKAESHGAVADDTSLQMRSYVAAVVGSEVVAEHFEMDNDRLTVSCTVRVTFDPDQVNKKLQEIAGNGELRQKLAAQQAEMDILASQVKSLSASVKSAAANAAQPAPPQAAAAPLPTLAAQQPAPQASGALSALPPPRYVPPRPVTYINPPAAVAAPVQTQAVYQPAQTVTVYPPAPTTYYYYQPYYQPAPVYAARIAYARRAAYARWYYAPRRDW